MIRNSHPISNETLSDNRDKVYIGGGVILRGLRDDIGRRNLAVSGMGGSIAGFYLDCFISIDCGPDSLLVGEG